MVHVCVTPGAYEPLQRVTLVSLPGFLVLGRRKENLVYTVRACAEFRWYPAYYMYSNVWSVSVYLLKGRSAGLYSL